MIKLYRKKKIWGDKLTVCVASIYENRAVLGAADRMITAGHIQYQPNSPKIWPLTNSIFALVAGDIPTQKVVFDSVAFILKDKIQTNPSQWMRVKEVAGIYSKKYQEEKNISIERKILAPFGLDFDSFISKQNDMSQSFISELSGKISQFDYPDIETLIIGCDEFGPHIFSVDNEEVACHDSIGFAARGVGIMLAESHFMSYGYSPSYDASHSLLYTHRAKKIAESAPGVGKETDIINIGPRLGDSLIFPEYFVSSLDNIFEKYIEGIKESDRKNFEITGKFVADYYAKILSETMKDQLINKSNSPIPQT
jgi:hypothetical protein